MVAGRADEDFLEGVDMTRKLLRMSLLPAVAALLAILYVGAAAAANGKPGDCFTVSPQGSFQDRDLTNEMGFNISTAEATLNTNGRLVNTSKTKYPAYSDGSYWVSNNRDATWNVEVYLALRRDFPNFPTNRAWFSVYPNGSTKGYLAAYSATGKFLAQVQRDFTSNDAFVLDTGLMSSRIGYVLVSFNAPGGHIGEAGDCVRWR